MSRLEMNTGNVQRDMSGTMEARGGQVNEQTGVEGRRCYGKQQQCCKGHMWPTKEVKSLKNCRTIEFRRLEAKETNDPPLRQNRHQCSHRVTGGSTVAVQLQAAQGNMAALAAEVEVWLLGCTCAVQAGC